MIKNFTVILHALFLIALHICFQQALNVCARAQTSPPKYVVDSAIDGACELNSSFIDELVTQAKKNKEKIFIISKISKGEKYKVNWYRLHNAFQYLTDGKEVQSEQVIVAVGTRSTEKKGRLEFYLGSELFLVSLAENGKEVCLTCCGSPS